MAIFSLASARWWNEENPGKTGVLANAVNFDHKRLP